MQSEITTTSCNIKTQNRSFDMGEPKDKPPAEKRGESRLYEGSIQTFQESKYRRSQPKISLVNSGFFIGVKMKKQKVGAQKKIIVFYFTTAKS